eukprot:5762887-Prymnesium_polylepis.1
MTVPSALRCRTLNEADAIAAWSGEADACTPSISTAHQPPRYQRSSRCPRLMRKPSGVSGAAGRIFSCRTHSEKRPPPPPFSLSS